MINKHVAFSRTDISIPQIYSSPCPHVLLFFGKKRSGFEGYIDQLSALHHPPHPSHPPSDSLNIDMDWGHNLSLWKGMHLDRCFLWGELFIAARTTIQWDVSASFLLLSHFSKMQHIFVFLVGKSARSMI
jgi:hypothetical protein